MQRASHLRRSVLLAAAVVLALHPAAGGAPGFLSPGPGIPFLSPVSGAPPMLPAVAGQAGGRILLRGAEVVDGTGASPYTGEVLVEDGRVVLLGRPGDIDPGPGTRVVDLEGLVLAPGFVDIHNHSTEGILEQPEAAALVSQGITTIVVGADGGSPWPIADYLARVDEAGPAVNVATMVGHGTVRRRVMGDDYRRRATSDEVRAMAAGVGRGMREGAFGLSTGLEYDPGFYSSTEELVALAETAAGHGGFYMSHMRDEEETVMAAIDEALRIGRDARLPVQISHIKMGNASVWGGSVEALAKLREARRQGVDVTADWYPYPAWASGLSIVVRSRQFDDPEAVAAGLEALGGADRLQITQYEPDPSIEGMRLDAIARQRNSTPVEVYMSMMDNGGARVIGHTMSPDDVDNFAADPLVMVASDGGIGSAHPRGAGTFPRVLGRYVREESVIGLGLAVHKMSGMPAERLGLTDRGRIRPGAVADLVAFDPDTVIDRSTFEEPGVLSTGIERVWVAGELVWDGESTTGARPGRALRHR